MYTYIQIIKSTETSISFPVRILLSAATQKKLFPVIVKQRSFRPRIHKLTVAFVVGQFCPRPQFRSLSIENEVSKRCFILNG